MRELAHHDPDQFDRVLSWPIREGLTTYLERLRDAAEDDYFRTMQLWVQGGGGKKPPPMPPILRGMT